MKKELVCYKCGTVLLDEIEIELEICGPCADAAYERYLERKEWDYWHNDESESLDGDSS